MIVVIGKSLHQIDFIVCTGRFQKDFCQLCRGDAFDPGIVDHLKSARHDLVGAAIFSERNTIANDASFLPVPAPPAAIIR